MEIKKWIGIPIIFILMACSQKTYNLQELKGTYQEVQTKNSKWNEGCTLIISDSTLSLKKCRLLKDFTGKKLRVVENRLLYHLPEYYTSFEIFEQDGKIHLFQSVEDNESITFKKVD